MTKIVGEVVWLKSGGPAMTVLSVAPTSSTEPRIRCGFFNDKDEYLTREFYESSLITRTPRRRLLKKK